MVQRTALFSSRAFAFPLSCFFVLLAFAAPGTAWAKSSTTTDPPIDSSVLLSNLQAAAQNGDAIAVLPSNAEISPMATPNPALIRSEDGQNYAPAGGPFSAPVNAPGQPYITGSKTEEGAGKPPSPATLSTQPDSKILQAAATQGDRDFQFDLGRRYETGQGVPQNYAEAARWYRLAAKQGLARAEYHLGFFYHHGLGVAQDYADAAAWYRRAAAQGDALAQNSLGFFYSQGLGVTQDNAEAVKWISRAANQGRADAQFNLGSLYLAGTGVSRNYRESYFWLTLAAEAGDKDAPEARQRVAGLLEPGQVSAVEARARVWKPVPAATVALR